MFNENHKCCNGDHIRQDYLSVHSDRFSSSGRVASSNAKRLCQEGMLLPG